MVTLLNLRDVDNPLFSMARPGKYFTLQCHMNDLVMDIDSDDSFAGTQVVTQEIDSSRDTQLWWCDDVVGVIRSRANEDLCLEVEDDYVIINEYIPGRLSQRFEISGNLVRHRENNKCVLEIAGMSQRAFSRICAMDYYRGDNQHWTQLHRPTEFCYVVNLGDEKVLDVSPTSGMELPRVALRERTEHVEACQLWWEDSSGVLHSTLNDMVLSTDKGPCSLCPEESVPLDEQWVKSGLCLTNRRSLGKTCLEFKSNFIKADSIEETVYKRDSKQHWRLDYISKADTKL